MKVEIENSVLKKELAKLKELVSARSTIPTLSNVLLEATENQELILKVTDLSTVVVTACPCEVIEPGEASLQAATLYKTLSNVNCDKISLETEENHWVKLKMDSSSCRIAGTHPGDHPSLPSDDGLDYHPVKPELMLDLINKTIFCVSTDNGRPAFCGGYFKYTYERRLVMVATDGARLACNESESDEFMPLPEVGVPAYLKKGAVLPEKGLKFLSKNIDPAAHDLFIATDEKYFFFKHGPMTVSMRVIDAEFPNYKQLAPKKLKKPLTIDRTELIQAIKFLLPFASDKNRIYFSMSPTKEAVLNLFSQDPVIGEGEKDVTAEYEAIDEEISVQMNSRFVLESLQAIEGDTVLMTLVNDVNQPTLIKDANRQNLIYVIMPYR